MYARKHFAIGARKGKYTKNRAYINGVPGEKCCARIFKQFHVEHLLF